MTIDDAAERRKRIDEIGRSWGLVENNMIEVSVLEAMHECWQAATEAAALKCDAEQKRLLALPFDGKNISSPPHAAAEPEKPTNDSQLTDNGRVGTTQGSDEARTRTPRSAHPSQAATPLLTTGPSQEGAAGSAATPTAMRVALESHAEPEKPVAWMYVCESHRQAGDPPTVTAKRWSAPLGNWTETPLYAAVQQPIAQEPTECQCSHDPTPEEESSRVCSKCGKPIIV